MSATPRIDAAYNASGSDGPDRIDSLLATGEALERELNESRESRGEIKLGDYVLAAKYSDYDPCDPWRIGFVVRIIDAWKPHPKFPTEIWRFYIIGEEDGTWQDFREYRHVKRITHEEGIKWLEAFRVIERATL